MNRPRFRRLLLIIGVALWTFALVPAWDHNDGGGVVTNRFCMGWWNSPLVDSLQKIEEGKSYSGTTQIRFISWSALAFLMGTICFAIHDKLQRRTRIPD